LGANAAEFAPTTTGATRMTRRTVGCRTEAAAGGAGANEKIWRKTTGW